jgi:DNA-binding MarR family transcriptional regulator
MSPELEVLNQIRELLEVMAEPALAQRDAKLRSAVRGIVGSGEKKAKAVLLMDGSRPQAMIAKEAGIDKSNLSKLVKALADAHVIAAEQKQPRLLLKIPSNFFDRDANE